MNTKSYQRESVFDYMFAKGGVVQTKSSGIIVRGIERDIKKIEMNGRYSHGEYTIMKALGSRPHVEKTNKLIVYNVQSPASLTVEHNNGGNLMNILSATPRSCFRADFMNYASQLACGLADIHSKGIAHRDINVDNIRCSADDGLLKIINFGASQSISESITQLGASSITYVAPELVNAMETFGSNYNVANLHFDLLKCDIFSLGVTFFKMFTSVDPFQYASTSDVQFVTFMLESQMGPNKVWESIPTPLRILLLNMCHVNPVERWNIKTVEKYLNYVAIMYGA
eukprot:CFRG6341T1